MSDFYNEETRERLNAQSLRLRGSWVFEGALTVGKEYLVVGLTFKFAPAPDEQGPSVIIVPDAGYLMDFPLALFEVTDPQLSRYWDVHIVVDRAASTTIVTLGPPAVLHDSDYLDRLVEGESAAVEELDHVLDLLKAEAEP